MSSEPRVAPQAPPVAATGGSRSRWTAGRITALGGGTLLVVLSLALLGGGGTGLWADLTQRDAGYVTTGRHSFSTSGAALATEHTRLGSAGVGWLYSPGLLGRIRVRVTPTSGDRPLFVGIGRSGDVDRYLAGVDHTVISDFFGNRVEAIPGGTPRSAPGSRRFWVASSAGVGARTLEWKPKGGTWTVVVMNADARRGVDVRADLGARLSAVRWIAVGALIAGAILLACGGLLIAGAIRRPGPGTNHERRSHAQH
ncbi:MAG TPA: hypothetical protein VLD16_11995 [Gaiellaceae bacterium]|nr:hypothetical protein [Gaiellaceae bacterium]